MGTTGDGLESVRGFIIMVLSSLFWFSMRHIPHEATQTFVAQHPYLSLCLCILAAGVIVLGISVICDRKKDKDANNTSEGICR